MADVPAQAVLNEAALKRVDPYVKEILDTAKYVALYSFNPKPGEWEKTNVEGSLFVYSRTGEPYHNILVLNRLNTTNLIEPITDKLDLQLQEPFLLYRNSKSKIYGIWFYEKDECTRFSTLIRNLMEKSVENPTAKNNSSWGRSVDILNMLSKAQEDFTTGKTSDKDKGKSPQEANATPQSVMEFFAKAGGAPQKGPPATSVLLARQHSVTTQDASDKLNPLLQKLMSNPVHTVEQIEKQQRCATPQVDSSQTSIKSLMRPTESEKAENGLTMNGFTFLRISSPSQKAVFPAEVSVPSSSLETPQKPALMPPAMFTPSASLEQSESALSIDKPEPLTRKQLLHAFNYLLKNDADFVNKIHEAYVKSLTDKGS